MKKTFKDLPLNFRVEVLKSLPRGYSLTYHNKSSKLDGQVVIKMADHNWLMMVLIDGVTTPIHYKNLCCDQFEIAIAVANKINQE